MGRRLRAEGYEVLNLDYPSRRASIEELARKAIGGALDDSRLATCSKVHFVTHSMGGILVRSYFSTHRDRRLGRVVMLGPPNQGSEVVDRLSWTKAFQWLNGPAGGELGTGKNSTPNRLGPVDYELGVISGDRSINWINSLMIPGPDDGKVSVERTKVAGQRDHVVAHVTHPFMMRDRFVIESTLRFLRTGRFR